MNGEKDIFQPSMWQNIYTINAQQRMTELTPEQMSITLANVTDEQLEAMIDEANQKGYSVNLNIPATKEIIDYFFEKLFTCKRCGKCCRGDFHRTREDGILIFDEEIVQIANLLKVRPRRIKRLCKGSAQRRLSLPYPCPFYRETPKPSCSVYSVRPLSCRYYPLYSVIAYEGLNENLNGKPLLSIDAECPQARDIALHIFKGMKNVVQTGQFNSLS